MQAGACIRYIEKSLPLLPLIVLFIVHSRSRYFSLPFFIASVKTTAKVLPGIRTASGLREPCLDPGAGVPADVLIEE